MTQVLRERRREPRLRSLNLVDVAQFNHRGRLAELTMGLTVDLSHGGTRVELGHPISVQSVVTLELALANRILEIQAVVTSVTPAPPRPGRANRWNLGFAFFDLDIEDYSALDDHLRILAEGN